MIEPDICSCRQCGCEYYHEPYHSRDYCPDCEQGIADDEAERKSDMERENND
jgi:uncharacterized Zn ribbon protein